MNIILASASPRRKEILENTNVKFKIMASSIEELTLEGESPCQMVMRLAFEKGIDIAFRQKSDLVISADTIVVLDNTVLGKPKDEIEARKMITSLSGRTHQVITGISLINLDNNKKIIDYVISNVKFKNLSEEDINDYIRTKESLDKAGAYGIQGYGALLVEEIQGDYFNIVGLPISCLLYTSTTVIRLYGGYPEGVSYSILLVNIMTPLIDKYTKTKVFGEVSK